MSSTDPYRPQPDGTPGQPYGQPPAGGPQVPYEQAQPYGQPAPQPGYGQPPAYGQAPGYGQPPAYGQQPPAYGQAPAYGQPPAWGQAPGYGQQPYDQPYGQGYAAAGYQPYSGYAPQPEYAHWGLRLGSWIIDGLVENVPANLVYAIATAAAGYGVLYYGSGTYESNAPIGLWVLASLVRWVISAWNRWFRQGRTGQSVGKTALRTRLVDHVTGQPVGAGRAFLRELAHILDALPFFLGYLWPLWDARRQTFADKIVGTVVVRG